jgi:hypothetical protein
VAVLIGLLALGAVSTVVWVTASQGSKEADLGSSLFSGLVVGVALLVVGRMFDATARRGQSDAAMQQLPDSRADREQTDTTVVVPQPAHVTVQADVSTVSTTDANVRTFELVYEGTQRDTSRLDAQQIRLRLFEIVADAEQPLYTQFVTIPVPSPELRRFVGADPNVTEGRLWWWIARSIEGPLIAAIQRGEVPTTKPASGYEVENYDLSDAVRRARQDSDPSHEVKANEVIYRFSTPSHSTREDELTMQVRQVVGYAGTPNLESEGPNQYQMNLHRPLTPDEQNRLIELATYNGVQLICRFDDGQTWTARPSG